MLWTVALGLTCSVDGSMPSEDRVDAWTGTSMSLNATVGPEKSRVGARGLAGARWGLWVLWWLELVQTRLVFCPECWGIGGDSGPSAAGMLCPWSEKVEGQENRSSSGVEKKRESTHWCRLHLCNLPETASRYYWCVNECFVTKTLLTPYPDPCINLNLCFRFIFYETFLVIFV